MKVKKLLLLFVVALTFMSALSFSSCNDEENGSPKIMSTSDIKKDALLSKFITDGNFPVKTLIVSYNNGGTYFANIGERDSINEPKTPIYGLLYETLTIPNTVFYGKYNFTCIFYVKDIYQKRDENGNLVTYKDYRIFNEELTDVTLHDLLYYLTFPDIKCVREIYRIDVYAKNK